MDLLYKYIITIFRGITWNNHPLTNYFRVPKEWGPKGFDPLGARHFLHGTFAILLMPCLGFFGQRLGKLWWIHRNRLVQIHFHSPIFFDSISWKIHFNPFETCFFFHFSWLFTSVFYPKFPRASLISPVAPVAPAPWPWNRVWGASGPGPRTPEPWTPWAIPGMGGNPYIYI